MGGQGPLRTISNVTGNFGLTRAFVADLSTKTHHIWYECMPETNGMHAITFYRARSALRERDAWPRTTNCRVVVLSVCQVDMLYMFQVVAGVASCSWFWIVPFEDVS